MIEKLRFKNKIDVQNYLVSQGYDISVTKKGALNSALAKKLGGLSKKGGYWLQEDVDHFGQFGKFKRLEGTIPEEIKDLDRKSKEAKLRSELADAEKKEMQSAILKGKYIAKTEVEKDRSHSLALWRTALDNFFIQHKIEITEKVNGELSLSDDMVDYCLENLEEFFDQYATTALFDVPTIMTEEG